jgi:hypothetical protein
VVAAAVLLFAGLLDIAARGFIIPAGPEALISGPIPAIVAILVSLALTRSHAKQRSGSVV